MHKHLKSWLLEYKWLIILCVFAVIVRLPQPLTDTIAFRFDHGKDSVAILHLIKTWKPALIGPWTSIPGLYFGPGWYYLLAPAFILSGGHPVAPVYLMMGLIIVQILLAERYLGKLEAIAIACAPLWLIISSSAWNPFPMTLLSLLILIALQQVRKRKKLTIKLAIILGLSAGFGFHFSTAFAIFYPPIIALSLLLRRVKLNWKAVLVLLIAFALPFMPQALFEVRHQFLETHAVINYLVEGRKQEASGATKVTDVLMTIMNESKLAILPEIWTPMAGVNQLISLLNAILLGAGVVLMVIKRKLPKNWLEILLFFIIPIPGFFLLHFNLWYILGLIPAGLLFCMFAIRQLPKQLQYFFVFLMLLTPISLAARFFSERPALNANTSLLPVKLQAISEVRKRANGQPFASYQYVPDIYDYAYQYLYMYQGFHGQQLPTEFSYKPGETAYILEKPELMAKLGSVTPTQAPVMIFYIVESADYDDFLKSWWGDQRYDQIVDSFKVGENVTVYQATPRK
ncbi:MAG: hypothetical protein ABI425_02130 [Patescibacteria group bacterium]